MPDKRTYRPSGFQVSDYATYRAQSFRAIVVRDACTNIQTISRSMGHTITSITSHPGFEPRVPGT